MVAIFLSRNATFQYTGRKIIKTYDSWMSLPLCVSWDNIKVAGQQLRYGQHEWNDLW